MTISLLIRRSFSSTASISKAKGSIKPFSLKPQNRLFPQNNHSLKQDQEHQYQEQKIPARTRFAPSPTGFIHLGSLRTALYNYLLAKSTGGQFLLRLEDTDQKRLVEGAEENIYKSLKWAGLNWDEGPLIGGPHGPYKQSERSHIYSQYIQLLLDSGHAYRCFCSRERLDMLSASARLLHPPSMASYDRKCCHLSREQSDQRAAATSNGEGLFTIRLKSPEVYPDFEDLLHGKISLQTPINYFDVRYDDPVLVKSDGLPTYHFANVIDDHLMEITHVIRGEEWLASTPKHLAIYSALGWKPPKFIHIPLLTSLKDKKLSKRSGDTGILSMAEDKGILPEALINFVALFGWSPHRDTVGITISELFTLEDLINQFSLEGLTKGNAKVDDKKLIYFNSQFFRQRLSDPVKFDSIVEECHNRWKQEQLKSSRSCDISESVRLDKDYTRRVLIAFGTKNLTSIEDFMTRSDYFYYEPSWDEVYLQKLRNDPISKEISKTFLNMVEKTTEGPYSQDWATEICDNILINPDWSKKQVYSVLRYILAGSISGVTIPAIMSLLGPDVVISRTKTIIENIERPSFSSVNIM